MNRILYIILTKSQQVTTNQNLPLPMTAKKTSIHIFGPCALESLEQITPVAELITKYKLPYLRAQLYKPRTNPDSFQGLGTKGLEILKVLRAKYSLSELKFVCEAGSVEQLKIVAPVASIIQIGARNMQNFELLKAVGSEVTAATDYVLLKRGFANTVEEWLESAKYLIQGGVPKEKILLCERGSRSLTSPTGVQLDFIAALEARKHGYKMIIDPSHGSKRAEFVLPLARASLQLDVDGVMIECHPEPAKSVSDAKQALSLPEMESFFKELL
jgi:3-deoxy-7-phosphoheptulonate synthase